MTEIIRKQKSRQASVFGILTSVVTALAVFPDIDSLDFSKPSTWLKLCVVVLPAIGGIKSQIK